MRSNFLKVLVFAAIVSLACTTKVSEWFLINSVPDRYLLVYYHNGDIPEPVIRQNQELESRISVANMLFKSVQEKEIENLTMRSIIITGCFLNIQIMTHSKKLSSPQ